MSTRIALNHRIDYRFEHPVRLSTQWLRLRPAPHCREETSSYSLKIKGGAHFINTVRDSYGNYLLRLDLPEPVTELEITVELIAELTPCNPFNFLLEPAATLYPFAYDSQLQRELHAYLSHGETPEAVKNWCESLDKEPASTLVYLSRINEQICEAFSLNDGQYQTVAVSGATRLIEQQPGLAAEPAGFLVEVLRSLGFAARFTSGFSVLLSDSATIQDSAALHVWAEVYLPGAGWVGLDPVLGIFTAETYIPLASAPDWLRVQAMAGFYEACELACSEETTVVRLTPQPLAAPYSEAGWSAIQALGTRLDATLTQQIPTLCIGRSIFFAPRLEAVSHSANGFESYAQALLRNLVARAGASGCFHLGQGEWFAGETLPRWRLNYYFRADGIAISPALPPKPSVDKPELADAKSVAEKLAQALGLSTGFVIPAYEDGLQQLWQQRSALGYPPRPAALSDAESRQRIAGQLSQSGNDPAGFVLPLQWDVHASCWRSGHWPFRRKRLYLAPGNSPLGYRLPLQALPLQENTLADVAQSPWDESRNPLHQDEGRAREKKKELAQNFPRTALCVEIRQETLHVFLPPMLCVEHYFSVIELLERIAAETGFTIIPEGYEPPADSRLRRWIVEPDVGAIKLTLPEAAAWAEHQTYLQMAYLEAAGLGLAGKRIAADGGVRLLDSRSDIFLCGTTPAQSPFLNKPHLLRSLIAYWHRHPCLSYFFAGPAVGQGGLAPRPDEGGDDALYELDIALAHIPKTEVATPWLIDRLLRRLLSDVACDVHRTEIDMDYLYPPDRDQDRLGKIALRTFASPPNAMLAAVQCLLLRAILAYLDRYPLSGPLGGKRLDLHDKFMLPGVLLSDLQEVLQDLKTTGYAFKPAWFEPFLALGFPVLGQVQLGDITLELRQAHEPWPILAEEQAAQGIARFVDTANTRLQASCRGGFDATRYQLICNNAWVPLQETSMRGHYLAGVRYKAAQPVSTLHPTLPVETVLHFDILDTWTQRTIGGCSYYPPQYRAVGPQGVPSFAANPGDAQGNRASRREARVSSIPISGSAVFQARASDSFRRPALPETYHPQCPYLLDLTRNQAYADRTTQRHD